MKVSSSGKEKIRNQINFILDQNKSGVPRDGIAEMLSQYIISLLENINNKELQKELQE